MPTPCYCKSDRPTGNFVRNPYTGDLEKIEGPILKNLDFHIEDDKRHYDDCRPTQGIDVHVTGIESYEQVKDLIGFVHKLWSENHGQA